MRPTSSFPPLMVSGVGGRWAMLVALDSHAGFLIPLSYSQALVLIRSSNAHGVDLFRGSFRCFAPLRRRKRSHLAMAHVSCYSHIDISKSHKLDNEGDDAFIDREEQKPGGLHLGVATY
ncbi:hypothetical protein Tco_1577515 [Tanacetum coccineum]